MTATGISNDVRGRKAAGQAAAGPYPGEAASAGLPVGLLVRAAAPVLPGRAGVDTVRILRDQAPAPRDIYDHADALVIPTESALT